MTRRAKRKRGQLLTQDQRELIVQAYALSGNKSQVVRELGISRPTVLKVLREAETNRDLQKARSRALESVAGQVHGKTVEILASITPEDMVSGRVFRKNADGQIVGKIEWGPSLLQKVTSVAILTDKIKVIAETKAAIEADGGTEAGGLPLPASVQGALRLLGTKIKRIRAIDIQMAENQPDLTRRIQDTVAAAEIHPDVEDADYEELDFDNPGAGVTGDGDTP